MQIFNSSQEHKEVEICIKSLLIVGTSRSTILTCYAQKQKQTKNLYEFQLTAKLWMLRVPSPIILRN